MLMFLELFGLVLGMAAGAEVPDVEKFKPVGSHVLEFRIGDYKTVFVGFTIIYQNMEDPGEFVEAYYRHAAVISERSKESGPSDSNQREFLSNSKYHEKEEAEALNRVRREIDGFAFVHWKVVFDERSGQFVRTGPTEFGLLDSNGGWSFYAQPEGDEESALKKIPLSEPFGSKTEIVGLKFVLGGAVHILRIDADDIMAKGAGDEKK